MQKIQSSFKSTFILYLLVLMLPFGFYYVYQSFQTIKNDTKTVRLASWTSGAIAHITLNTLDQNHKQSVKDVNMALENISKWVMQNEHSELYIGATTLSEDFSKVQSCWDTYIQKLTENNENILKQHARQCYEFTENLAIIIEKMVYLKQSRSINIFYLSLIVSMLFLLLAIYMMRIYIHQQIKKHAIHDHETKLFNQKYFLAELKTSCARAIRNDSPLSLLYISIDDLQKETTTYDKKTQEHILKLLGGLITSLTRESDVACRYDENHFSILLPDTSEANALILKKRVREAFEKHDFGVSPELHFKFATAHLNDKESPETFRIRTEKLLK